MTFIQQIAQLKKKKGKKEKEKERISRGELWTTV